MPGMGCYNERKSLMRPNDGKHIAKGKSVHLEVESKCKPPVNSILYVLYSYPDFDIVDQSRDNY